MIKIEEEDFYIQIKDEEHLDVLLKKYGLLKYVGCHKSIDSLIRKHPILDSAKIEFVNNDISFSSKKLNVILNYKLIPYKAILSSFVINVFLNAYYNIGENK